MINYTNEHKGPNAIPTDDFATSLKESAEYFSSRHQVSVLGENFKDVLTDNTLFSDYSKRLTEGLNATETDQMLTLFENNRVSAFREATAGIPGLTSLSMPTIRKMWAKIALKYAIPTEPVKTPTFSISFSRGYIQDPETNEKQYLPDALRDPRNNVANLRKIPAELHALPLKNKDLLADAGASAAVGDSLDRQFFVSGVTMEVLDAAGLNPELKTLTVRTKVDLNNRIYLDVTAKHTDGTSTTDSLLGSMNPEAGTVQAIALNGNIKSVKFDAAVSSESHNRATSISFEITKRDITIGTGEHFEAALPLEMLQDTMALYNIDGANEMVDLMSNVIATKLDQEIYQFIDNSFISNPTYNGQFDIHPAPQYAGNPKNWLEEIKRVIDLYAQKLKSQVYFTGGSFVIIGNPLDTAIIPNVSWTLNRAVDAQNGIDVEYSIGAVSGAHRYTIISSDLIPQGELTMFFVPNTDRFLTYKYYPYTFNVVQNYLNTKTPQIPGITMTKRHTMEEFIPMVAKIRILNNDGTLVAR